MRRRTFLTASASAWALAGASPEKTALNAELLARIPARLKQFVDKGSIPGAVTLLQRHGTLAQLEAVGYQDLEEKKPMRTDTIFRIASMTKPVTSAGVLILMEEGKLALNDPIEKYLPDFRGQWMVTGRDGTKSMELRHPARPETLRDAMTHTSGMYSMPPETLEDAFARSNKTLAEFMTLASQKPLEFEPGTKWQYSNYGIAALGRTIEVVTGQPYEKFMAERIFQPLGMKDSFFFPPEEKKSRLGPIYLFDKGKLVRSPWELMGNGARYPYPEGGMSSTASDLAAFYQMMLDGGTYRGHRILSRASVEVMTEVHTGNLPVSWGLGWSVVKDAAGTLPLTSLGTFSHGGAFGTYGWIDPKKGIVGVFLVQRPGANDERNAFVQMAGAAVD